MSSEGTDCSRARRKRLIVAKPTSVGPGQRHEGLGQIYFWETGIKFEVGRGLKRRTKLFLGTVRIDSMPKMLHTKRTKKKQKEGNSGMEMKLSNGQRAQQDQ